MGSHIVIDSDEEAFLRKELDTRSDFESSRMQRYLNMPDLSRAEESPLKRIIDEVTSITTFKDFDIIQIPEIVPADISFDMFNFSKEHPARNKSDTYYASKTHILRTHDTVMWHYYLNHKDVKDKIVAQQPLGVICYGKVYRKDEIDRHHMNVFHQMGGLYLVPDSQKTLTLDDLKSALTEIAQSIFGKEVTYRFNVDTFPYTDPSLEMEIDKDGKWVEILGGGVPLKSVLKNFGLEGYNGWAFGFGLERLAIIKMHLPDIRLLWSEDARVKKQLSAGQKYIEVSKFPPVPRDISFIVNDEFVPNDYFDLIRHIGGDLVEEVELMDKYENEAKFGPGRTSYTYHIVYRSADRTLTNEEVEPLQNKLYEETKTRFNAELR